MYVCSQPIDVQGGTAARGIDSLFKAAQQGEQRGGEHM
jgi:hypothetical protein